jgi:hypothetical protein
MNDIFQCGDSGALVAYLYDECALGEREQIAAHLKQCATCASEIDSLRATRQTLAAWTPPDLALGFQITRTDVGPAPNRSSSGLEPKIAWWRAPLPGWAQAAAALVIFAAGLSVGIARNGSSQLRPVSAVSTVASRGSDEALIQQVRSLIEESEANQRKDFTLRMVELAGNIEQQRRVDLQTVRQSMGQLQDVTGTELRQQREVLGRLVSERTR